MSFAAGPKADSRVDQWSEVSVGGVKYLRLPLHTRWLDETDDLALALKEHLKLARPGDTVGISEKAPSVYHRPWTSTPCNLDGWLDSCRPMSSHAPIRRGWRSRRRWSTCSVPSA